MHVHDASLSLKPFSFPRRCAKLKIERKSWELGESGRILSSLFCFVLCGMPREGGKRQKMKKKNEFFDFFFFKETRNQNAHTHNTYSRKRRENGILRRTPFVYYYCFYYYYYYNLCVYNNVDIKT